MRVRQMLFLCGHFNLHIIKLSAFSLRERRRKQDKQMRSGCARAAARLNGWPYHELITWGNRLISVDEQIDDRVGEVVELGHAESIVVGGAHEGEVLRPDRVLGVLDLQNARLGMVEVLLLALFLLLHAIRAATGEVGVELRVLVVGRATMGRLLVFGDLILPVVVHRLDLLLQPLILLVEQVLLVLSACFSYINYHECRGGD